jgi:hypothetical protein
VQRVPQGPAVRDDERVARALFWHESAAPAAAAGAASRCSRPYGRLVRAKAKGGGASAAHTYIAIDTKVERKDARCPLDREVRGQSRIPESLYYEIIMCRLYMYSI